MRVSPDRPDLGVHVFNTRGVSTRVFLPRAGPADQDRQRSGSSGLFQLHYPKYGGLWGYHAPLPSSPVICLYGSDHRSNLFGRPGGAVGQAAYRLRDGGRPIIEHMLAAAFSCGSACLRISRPPPTASDSRTLGRISADIRTRRLEGGSSQQTSAASAACREEPPAASHLERAPGWVQLWHGTCLS